MLTNQNIQRTVPMGGGGYFCYKIKLLRDKDKMCKKRNRLDQCLDSRSQNSPQGLVNLVM